MNQTRLGSLIEAVFGTVIGFLTTLCFAPIVYPLFGHSFTLGQNLGIASFFTALSVLRGYFLRRWFNARLKRAARQIAERIAA